MKRQRRRLEKPQRHVPLFIGCSDTELDVMYRLGFMMWPPFYDWAYTNIRHRVARRGDE